MTNRVYVVDDNDDFRQSLIWLLSAEGFDAYGFDNAQEVLDNLENQPDCLITDVRMPGMSGLQLQRAVRQVGSDLPILFMTAHGDVPLAVEAMQNGAVDFFEKPFAQDQFVEAVKKACESKSSGGLREEVASQLTPREREVLELVVAGSLNKIIADELNISIKTVEMHRSNIKNKLGVKNLAELVQVALKG